MASQAQKMKNYASFSQWYENQSDRNQVLIKELQSLIENVAPQLTTTVKWGQGCWADSGSPKVFIHTEDDHVQLGFYNGASLRDPGQLLSGNGKYVRFVRVYNSEGIKPEQYTALILQAVTGS
jgi:hypothetical protein